MTRPPPLLVLGVGNPSRGDDALAPLLLERAAVELAAALARGELELLTDFQLQIEHALDLVGRARVLFVDASVRAAAPFELARVTPARDASATSHALSPAAVLATHAEVVGAPPEAWLLAIRGERFELGEGLSDAARVNLEAAVRHLAALVTGRSAWAPVGQEVVSRQLSVVSPRVGEGGGGHAGGG
ncbi:MAG: hydrogenase maturation protease [Myxococcales bacterium]|nr:hydrogenase maturation protease [Myxococcales bacterium]